MTGFTESVVEEAALGWLGEMDYSVLHGPDIAAGQPAAERADPGSRRY
jgi:type I restriction enzyme R subunit